MHPDGPRNDDKRRDDEDHRRDETAKLHRYLAQLPPDLRDQCLSAHIAEHQPAPDTPWYYDDSHPFWRARECMFMAELHAPGFRDRLDATIERTPMATKLSADFFLKEASAWVRSSGENQQAHRRFLLCRPDSLTSALCALAAIQVVPRGDLIAGWVVAQSVLIADPTVVAATEQRINIPPPPSPSPPLTITALVEQRLRQSRNRVLAAQQSGEEDAVKVKETDETRRQQQAIDGVRRADEERGRMAGGFPPASRRP